MRATVADHRLEAIAGEPHVVVTTPQILTGAPSGTLLGIGVYEYAPENPSSQQLLIHDRSANGYAYVRNDPGSWLVGTEVTVGQFDNIWWAWTYTIGGRVGLGCQRLTGADYWKGFFNGVIYDKQLTEHEVMRVVQHLYTTLGVG